MRLPFVPAAVIHCAAERRPDAAAADPEAARKLNALVPGTLSKLAAELDFRLVYISTDCASSPLVASIYQRSADLSLLESTQTSSTGPSTSPAVPRHSLRASG